MPMAPKRAFVTINGEALKIKTGTAKLTPGGPSGSPVVSDDGTVDTSYENMPCMMEMTVIMTPGNNFESTLRGLQDGVGTWRWDSGEQYSITGISANDAGNWTWDGDGLACKFHANPAKPA